MQSLLKMLMDGGQEHVCSFWAPVGTNDDAKHNLVQQLTQLDGACPTGAAAVPAECKAAAEGVQGGREPV